MRTAVELDNGLLLELFKVQLPLETNAPYPLTLIYNQDRSIEGQILLSMEIIKIARDFQAKGWINNIYKFYILGALDDKGSLQVWSNLTTQEDQQQEW